MNTPNAQPWMADARCTTADPETFFPSVSGGNLNAIKAAKAVCGDCATRTACLEYALADRDLYGIWGGTTEAERDKLRGAA